MQFMDDFIRLQARDLWIALDFSWTVSRQDLGGGEFVLHYHDAHCHCRMVLDRLDRAGRTRGVTVQRDGLHGVSGGPSGERIDAIIALVNRVVHWGEEQRFRHALKRMSSCSERRAWVKAAARALPSGNVRPPERRAWMRGWTPSTMDGCLRRCEAKPGIATLTIPHVCAAGRPAPGMGACSGLKTFRLRGSAALLNAEAAWPA